MYRHYLISILLSDDERLLTVQEVKQYKKWEGITEFYSVEVNVVDGPGVFTNVKGGYISKILKFRV